MELPKEVQAFLYAVDTRLVARLAPAAYLSFLDTSYSRYGYRRKGHRLCVVSAVGGDDAPLQPYCHRLYPLQNTPAHLHTYQHLAHIGFLHQIDETADEVLRHQIDGRPATTH